MDKPISFNCATTRDARSKVIFYDDTSLIKQNTLVNEWSQNEFSHRTITKQDTKDLIKFPAFHQKHPSGSFKYNETLGQRIVVRPVDELLQEYSSKIQKLKKNLAYITPTDRKLAFIHACNQLNLRDDLKDSNTFSKSIITHFLLEETAPICDTKHLQRSNLKKIFMREAQQPNEKDRRFKSVHLTQIKAKGRTLQTELDNIDNSIKLDPINLRAEETRKFQIPKLQLSPRKLHTTQMKTLQSESTTRKPYFSSLNNSEKKLKYKQFPAFFNYFDMNFIINISNNLVLESHEDTKQPVFKFYIGQGNNLSYVKQLLKSRQYWIAAQSKDDKDINLIFTQTFKKHFVHQITGGLSEKADCFDYQESKSFEAFPLLSEKYGLQIKQTVSTIPLSKYTSDSNAVLETYSQSLRQLQPIGQSSFIRIYNHIEGAQELDSKKVKDFIYQKLLLLNLRQYCLKNNLEIDSIVPQTFILGEEKEDFKQSFNKSDAKIWIVKPSEDTNRGQGIQGKNKFSRIVMNNYEQIINFVKNNGKSYIIQKYIENPLLYQSRKFDIRCFCLITIINCTKRAYWFNAGYVRTSSKTFDMNNINSKNVHLTNDAIQMKSNDYGKFEKGNKLSLEQFEEYLRLEKKTLDPPILDQLKSLTIKAILSSIGKMTQQCQPTFEIFGLDFMITDQLKPLLIEFNTNPCLEMSCPVLSRVIGKLLQNVIRIVLDPLFPSYNQQPSNLNRLRLDDLMRFNCFEVICEQS